MLSDVSIHLRSLFNTFTQDDRILLGNASFQFDQQKFLLITPLLLPDSEKTIAFVDGGQAEILRAGNFIVSFIRVHTQTFAGLQKKEFLRYEFFLVTRAIWHDSALCYKSSMITDEEKLFSEDLLFVSSHHPLLKKGNERADLSVVVSMARRFAELVVARRVGADYVVLDGTMDVTYPGEEQFLSALGKNVCALAKSSSLFTMNGNSPAVLLQRSGPSESWVYPVNEVTLFVKLHPSARHIFRFEGNQEVLPYLLLHSTDALFLGYPYGLVFADRMARVSNQEQKSLFLRLMLDERNKEIKNYLTTLDAHSILDSLS